MNLRPKNSCDVKLFYMHNISHKVIRMCKKLTIFHVIVSINVILYMNCYILIVAKKKIFAHSLVLKFFFVVLL